MKHTNSCIFIRIVFYATLFFIAPVTKAALITIGTGDLNVVGSSPPETNNDGGRDEDNLVNGSGMGVNIDGKVVAASAQPNGNNWNTLTDTAYITFDLGGIYDIKFIHIWNFFDNYGNTDFGPESIDLLVSSVGTSALDADFSGVGIVPTLPISHAPDPPGNDTSLEYLGENYRFGGMTEADIPAELDGVLHNLSFISLQGRFVRFANLDGSLSYGGRTGLSEVRFYGDLIEAIEPIPLPASVWLFGSGLLMLMVRRKLI